MAAGARQRAARRLVAAAMVAAALVLARPAPASAQPMPTGRISVQTGGKAATGAFASRIGLGIGAGLEAAYQPLRPDQSIGLGLTASTMWSYYFAGSARVADAMSILEMGIGARARVPLGARRRQVLFLGGGAALVRFNEPPVLGADRSYVGPWATAGIEGVVLGIQLGIEARYVLARSDDGTIGLLLSVGTGS